ncbi:MAG: hypothetical protein E7496_01930 [Ruminococcus sp.]|nr:hypothetical protein [Ruminococcus sp.]
MNAFNQEKQQEELEIKKLEQEINQLIAEIEAEQNQLKSALSRAYSANIIPLQFRNIEGVYYLYDYLSTSQQSLQSALIQANLDAIKKKLDEIISNQGEMILQQAQTNKMLFSQNQQMIASLQRIQESAVNTEQNSLVASQYAQISASNSETALIMQKEQLAYQKADYWMKYHDIL